MSLHDTTEFAKKAGIVLSISLGVILMLVVFFKIGGVIHAMLFPPQLPSPNEAYGKLPPIAFPKSDITGPFTYSINTVNGSLPSNFPDRLIVYPMIISEPSLLNLKNAESAISNIGFTDSQGNLVPAVAIGGSNYQWKETAPDSNGFENTMDYNIITENFTMTSNYLTQLSVLQGQYIQSMGGPTDAISIVQDFVNNLDVFPPDIDLTLTQNAPTQNTYNITPQMYSVTAGQLTPATALAAAQVIRVDLYQKEIDYSIQAGQNQDATQFQNFPMKLPILYPHPPYSTMNFYVASGQGEANVVQANYNHQTVNLQPTTQATYPIKTAQQAFDDLKNGKGYIASYNGTGSNQILITNVFLAYYIGTAQQNYLTPVVVFQGQNGFFAYVPAVTDDAIQ